MAAAKWQFILVLEEGKRKCPELSAESLPEGLEAYSRQDYKGAGYQQEMSTGIFLILLDHWGNTRVSHYHFFVLIVNGSWKALLWKGFLVKCGHW